MSAGPARRDGYATGAGTRGRSYYGRPVIKEPVWTPEIPIYFYTGGVAGGAALVGTLARVRDERRSARAALLVGAAGDVLSAALLTSDLGRPARFLNMLRVFKVTSPMSVGSWVLTLSGSASGAAVALELLGRLPRAKLAFELISATLGPALTVYTGVLISDTAVPVWHEARRRLPFLFGASALASTGAVLTAIVPLPDAAPARRLAIAGTLTENLLMPLMEKRLGFVGEVYAQGPAKRSSAAPGRSRSAARRSSRWRVVGTAVRRRSAVPRRRPVSCACGGPSSRRGLGRRVIRSTRSLPSASASTGVPRAEGAIGELGVGLAPVEGRGRRWEGHLVDVDGVAAGVDPEVPGGPPVGVGPVGVSLDLEDVRDPLVRAERDEPTGLL